MKKAIHPVTDHAVVRYLERVQGVDIDALRAEIGRIADDGLERGAAAVNHDGFRYVLAGDRVVTVELQNRPERGQCTTGKRGWVPDD